MTRTSPVSPEWDGVRGVDEGHGRGVQEFCEHNEDGVSEVKSKYPGDVREVERPVHGVFESGDEGEDVPPTRVATLRRRRGRWCF